MVLQEMTPRGPLVWTFGLKVCRLPPEQGSISSQGEKKVKYVFYVTSHGKIHAIIVVDTNLEVIPM